MTNHTTPSLCLRLPMLGQTATGNSPAVAESSVYTDSRFRCWRDCPRKHYFRYELGVRSSRSAAYLALGSAVHAGIEAHHAGLDAFGVHAPYKGLDAYAALDALYPGEPSLDSEIARRMFAGWQWRWATPTTPETTIAKSIAAEQAFSLDFDGIVIAGKIDGVVQLADGRTAVHEVKTTSEQIDAGADYWTRLRLDSQVSLYLLAARALGYDAATVLYDVIRKPMIEPRKVKGEDRRETLTEYGDRLTADIGERPEFYYARREVPRLDNDLDEALTDIRQQVKAIERTRADGAWYRNPTACVNRGKCEYLSVCHSGFTLDHLPEGFSVVKSIHPELGVSL